MIRPVSLNIIRETIGNNFDKDFYLRQNEDVKSAGHDPIVHYIEHGWREGRNPSRLFWTNYYLQSNEDVKKTEINPFFHFLVQGRLEGRRPNPVGAKLIGEGTVPSAQAWRRLSRH